MSRDDWKWWGATFGLVLLLAVALHAVAWNLPPEGYRFSGFLVNSGDQYGYQAFARSYAEGGWLIDNPYAIVARPPVFFNLFWLLVGKAMWLTGLPFLAVYYAVGIVAAGLLYLAILLVMREFLGDGPRARFAYLLAGFASGAGWLGALFLLPGGSIQKVAPLDLFYPEGYPLQAALGFPHQALSFALLAFVMLWAWRGTVTGRRRWMAAAGGLSLVLGFFHPYPLVSIAAVMVAWYLVLQVRRGWAFLPRWLDLGFLGAGILPPVLYYHWLFNGTGNFVWWGRTNVVHATVVAVLLGLGPLVALAAAGLWRRRRDGEVDEETLFLVTWAGVNLALLFAGRFINFEAKLVEGLVLPLAALGSAALFQRGGFASATVPGEGARGAAGNGRGWVLALLVLALLLPGHAYRLGSALRLTYCLPAEMIPVNWRWMHCPSEAERLAVKALRDHAPKDAVIMARWDSGVFLAAHARVRPFLGHELSTPGFEERLAAQEWYYSDRGTEIERWVLLMDTNVSFVWEGPNEREGAGRRLGVDQYLETVYDNGPVRIHRVRPLMRQDSPTGGPGEAGVQGCRP